jgi:hypothetical protein
VAGAAFYRLTKTTPPSIVGPATMQNRDRHSGQMLAVDISHPRVRVRRWSVAAA